jgi:hypothetical protein
MDPNDKDRSLNETDTDKIRKYRGDYNNLIITVPLPLSLSFLQVTYSTSGKFHYLRTIFTSQFRWKIGSILTETTTLRITLNTIIQTVHLLCHVLTLSHPSVHHHTRKPFVY